MIPALTCYKNNLPLKHISFRACLSEKTADYMSVYYESLVPNDSRCFVYDLTKKDNTKTSYSHILQSAQLSVISVCAMIYVSIIIILYV